MRPLALSLVLLASCAKPDPVAACEAFVAADIACATQATGEPSDRGPGDLGAGYTCEGEYGDLKGKAADGAVVLHECYTQALEAADCTSQAGYDAAVASLADCEGAP